MQSAVLLMFMNAGLLMVGQVVPGSMGVEWNAGAVDCEATPQSPLQVHTYEPQTFILRQGLCFHHEANFIYLLVGSESALLLDTGVEADTGAMPLAQTVLELLPAQGDSTIPLIVTHSHGHRDHRAGDPQFADVPSVQLVPADRDGVLGTFGFEDWPNDIVRLDLGDRPVHLVPAPGHHPDHLVLYDERTGLLLSGDFLLPGRLLIDDITAYRESADRLIAFLENRPVAHILGSHLEMDVAGRLYPFRSQYRPDQRPLQLTGEDLVALFGALNRFNGFYSRHENFVLANPVHNLSALIGGILVALTLIAWGVLWFFRRRSRTRAPAGAK